MIGHRHVEIIPHRLSRRSRSDSSAESWSSAERPSRRETESEFLRSGVGRESVLLRLRIRGRIEEGRSDGGRSVVGARFHRRERSEELLVRNRMSRMNDRRFLSDLTIRVIVPRRSLMGEIRSRRRWRERSLSVEGMGRESLIWLESITRLFRRV